MEDRRTAIALLLSFMLVMFYTQLLFPSHTQRPAQNSLSQELPPPSSSVAATQGNASVAASTSPAHIGSAPTTPGSSSAAPATRPSLATVDAQEKIVIRSDVSEKTIALLGGRARSIILKGYKQHLGSDSPYEMVSLEDGAPLPLGVYGPDFSDDEVQYRLVSPTGNSGTIDNRSQEAVLVLEGSLPKNRTIRKKFTFPPNSFLFSMEVTLSPAVSGGPVWVGWSHVVPPSELNVGSNLKKFTILNNLGKIKNVFAKDTQAGFTDLGPAQWIAFDDYYFMEALLPSAETADTRVARDGNAFLSLIQGTSSGGVFRVYTGPKVIQTLEKVGASLERAVDLGIFSFLAHPILALLTFSHGFLGNYGLAIIFLTLLIKLAFLPLTQVSFKSMQAMQDLQPEIQALRERIQDPNVLNQEMMALYKKRGVNPLGGCLPILIQIPVFFGLYNALLNSIDLRHAPFALWITDLSTPERLEIFGMGVPLMILIMGASMILQQWLTPSAMDPQQKKIMLLMPFIFTLLFIIHPMPSGLVLYWLVNNIISIIQQIYIKNDRKASPLMATAYSSLGIMTLGYVLVLIS